MKQQNMNKRIYEKVKHKLLYMTTEFYHNILCFKLNTILRVEIRYTIDNPEENIRAKIWDNLNGANPWNPVK